VDAESTTLLKPPFENYKWLKKKVADPVPDVDGNF
jgi:hypothetical protein